MRKQMAATAMAVFLASWTFAAQAGETYALDFKDEAAAQDAKFSNNPNKPNARASGKIQKPFADNSSWCEVWTEYEILDEGGTKFQRVKVTRIQPKSEGDKSTVGQIIAPMGNLKGKASCKLKLKARSSTSSDVTIMVRIRPEPYTALWKKSFTLGNDWKNYDYDFDIDIAEDTPIAFYMQFPKVGTVDIAEFKIEKK